MAEPTASSGIQSAAAETALPAVGPHESDNTFMKGLLLLRSRPARGQMNMIKMIGLGGLFTAFWGVMYGSYFGYEWFPPVIMSPMGDPLSMLIMCFGFGILHLVTGLVTKMVVSFKAGDWQAAVFDAMPWVMILVGLPLLAGSMLGVAWLPAAGMALVIAGAALVLAVLVAVSL